MKLHLPVALLFALVSAAGYSLAETTPTEISVGDGTYSYTTSADGTVEATFTGDGTTGSMGGGYTKSNGHIGGVPTGYINGDEKERVASNTNLVIGGVDENGVVVETKLNRVTAAGVKGYVVTGDKKVTVKEGAEVSLVLGSYDLDTKYGINSLSVDKEPTQHTEGIPFAPKSPYTATITINVEGGEVNSIYTSYTSSNVIANEVTAAKKKLSGEALAAYLEDPAWAVNETVNINLQGGKITNMVLGGGFLGAVNNTVTINVSGDETEVAFIYGGSHGNSNYDGYVKNSIINIDGGTVTGSVYGGGYNSDSYVKEDTQINLTGGEVQYNVYAAGDGDTVQGGTKVTISGEGTKVGGVISGSGKNGATVDGDRILEVDADHDSSGREQGYKLADFTEVNVEGKIRVDELTVATEGTDVKVGSSGAIVTQAGTLAGVDNLEVEGTLTVDVTNANQDEAAVSGESLTLGDAATINIIDNSGRTDEISLFGFDNVDGGEELALTMNGQSVSNDMWDFSNGGIVIKQLSASTLSLSANQGRFYQVLQAMNAAGAADAGLAALATSRDSAAVRSQINALSGHELATAVMSQVDGNLGHLRRLRGAMGKGTPLGTTTSVTLCSANNKGEDVGYVAPVTTGQRWRAGVQAYYEESELDADSCGDGYDRSETGAMLTAEYYVKEGLTLGGALSRGRTTLKTDGARKRHEDNTSLDFYALYGKNRWQFASAIGFGMHEHDLKRSTTSAEADGYSVNFLQDVAYTVLAREKDTVQMFGTIESTWNKMNGFTEKGAYALRVDDQDSWTTDVTVGVRYNHMLPAWGSAPAGVFSAQAGVTGTLGDVDAETEMSLNGFRFSQESARRDRWGWNIGVGVDVPVRSNVSIYATAETVVRGDSNSVDGQIGVKVAF